MIGASTCTQGRDGTPETARPTPPFATSETKKAQAREQGVSLNPPSTLCIWSEAELEPESVDG